MQQQPINVVFHTTIVSAAGYEQKAYDQKEVRYAVRHDCL